MQLTAQQLQQAQQDALKQHQDSLFKAEVERQKLIFVSKKAHFFPKKLVFQWPFKSLFRLENWYNAKGL